MKRLGAILVAATIGLSILPIAAHAMPSVSPSASQSALAAWTATEDGTRVVYFAFGSNGYPNDWPTVGTIGRAVCKKMVHNDHVMWRCRGDAHLTQLGPGDFVVDPALSSATLQISDGDVTNSVTWHGLEDAATPYVHQHAGTDVGVQVMAMMQRRASIDGMVDGVTTSTTRGGALMQGVDFNIYPDGLRVGRSSFSVSDGVVHFRTTL
ncbi:MAG TPA: hypothetical protein VFK89_05970 [Actinomycetota bacterium]|nr:hypothetical protein [Actinomycetota bacterium]